MSDRAPASSSDFDLIQIDPDDGWSLDPIRMAVCALVLTAGVTVWSFLLADAATLLGLNC